MSQLSTDDLAFYGKVFCTLAKKGRTIVDASRMLRQPVSQLTPIVKSLCQIPQVDAIIGHWPQVNSGSVFLANHVKIDSLCDAKHGQQVWTEKLNDRYWVLFDSPAEDTDGNRLPRRQLGTTISRALRSINGGI